MAIFDLRSERFQLYFYYYLQVTPILHTKFRVNLPFDSGEVKIRLSRWPPLRPSRIPNQKKIMLFLMYKSSDSSYQVSSQMAFRIRWSSKDSWELEHVLGAAAMMLAVLRLKISALLLHSTLTD